MRITVLISAFRNLDALRYCLTGYANQTRLPDQIIVAEDDESEEIRAFLATRPLNGIDVMHVSQPNQGFRKCKIMNAAILRASGDLLIFTDADCIPRNDFVAMHLKKSRRGRFLSGGSHIDIPQQAHQNIDLIPLIESQRLFQYDFLATIPGFAKGRSRLTRNSMLAGLLDLFTQRNVLSGSNASAFKTDVLAVGGFDESMGYGGEDKNLGFRLNNLGIRGRRLRYSLCCVHLDHPRGYVSSEIILQNKALNNAVRKKKVLLPGVSSLMDQTV